MGMTSSMNIADLMQQDDMRCSAIILECKFH